MKKKIKKKIPLILVLIVILLIGVISYVFFSSDILKSEKAMFFKYALGKGIEYKADKLDKKLAEYINKKTNESFTSQGDFNININGLEKDKEQKYLEILKNTKGTFQGQTNPKQELEQQALTLDFGNGNNISAQYRRDIDIYAIQADTLDSKFIAIKNESLQNLASKFELDIHDIPDRIDFENIKFTKEELKALKNKYLTLLSENLEDELFSKEKAEGQTVIKLEMSSAKAKDVLEKLLEKLRKDEIILDKIPLHTIDSLSRTIDSLIYEENMIEIKVYMKDKQTQKCEVLIFENEDYEKSKIIIEKIENGLTIKSYSLDELTMDIKYTVEKNNNDIKININAKFWKYGISAGEYSFNIEYKNLSALDNVEENIDIKAEYDNTEYEETSEKTKIDIVLNNKITFGSNEEIERLEEENCIILNNMMDEEVKPFLTSVYQKLGLI